jgi:hypothetical protein
LRGRDESVFCFIILYTSPISLFDPYDFFGLKFCLIADMIAHPADFGSYFPGVPLSILFFPTF